MKIEAIKTDIIMKGQNLYDILDKTIPEIKEKSIVAITSKVVSICEGRLISKNSISKEILIKREADKVIENPDTFDKNIVLTYKNNILIPSAGIDESNANNNYVLYPKFPFLSAKNIYNEIKIKRKIDNFGILITDSHTTPLRYGVTGIGIAWWGFNATTSYIGKPDLFGKKLKVTKINCVDALASGAVFTMGESNECKPFVVITDIPHIEFNSNEHENEEICIDPKDDLYRPLLKQLIEKG